jgi:DNA-binding LacI/PurR family transcriptional regulator
VLFFLIGILVLVFRTAGLYRKTIASECKSLAEYISALAYDNLTQTFPASIHQPRFTYLKVIYHEIEEIKQSYNNLTATPLERICYVGTDPYIEGINCARAMADFCNKRSKIIVIITVSLDISNLDLRYRGFKNVFLEESPGMEIIDVFEARGNTEQAHDYVVSALREHPELAGIYISGGTMAAPAALALEETGKAGRVALVCHDLGMEMAD